MLFISNDFYSHLLLEYTCSKLSHVIMYSWVGLHYTGCKCASIWCPLQLLLLINLTWLIMKLKLPTSHSGIPTKWQAWYADTAWLSACGSLKPENADNDAICMTQAGHLMLLKYWILH